MVQVPSFGSIAFVRQSSPRVFTEHESAMHKGMVLPGYDPVK